MLFSQQMKTKRSGQALKRCQVRRTVSVPEKLGEIIRGANSIPPDAEFPQFPWIEAKPEHLDTRGADQVMNRSLQHLRERLTIALDTLAKFPKEKFPDFYELTAGSAIENISKWIRNDEVVKNVGSFSGEYQFLWHFFNECRLMADAREVLRTIARRGQLQKWKISPGFSITGNPLQMSKPGLQMYHRLSVNAKGRIEFKPSRLSKALFDVEASRIRLCQNCGKIYWAGRKDQPCCSKNCANTRRVKLWMQNSGTYKENRIKAESKREEALKGRKMQKTN
jgi:hypothetical protein